MKERGVFIKGAWVDIRPWEEGFTNYYCCPGPHLYVRTQDNGPNAHPGYQFEKIYQCGYNPNELKDIGISLEETGIGLTVLRPEWCPLRKEIL